MRFSDIAYAMIQYPIAISSAVFIVAWVRRSLPVTSDGSDFFAWGLVTYGTCVASILLGLVLGWRPGKLGNTTAGRIATAPLVVEAVFILFGTWTLYRVVSEGAL